MKYTRKTFFSRGFTIVELTIVIIVIGILAGISVIGYGKWRESIAQKEVQSDLQMAAAAMENAKNFGTGYPDEIPETFKGSSNVSVSYYSGDNSSYCIDGVSVPNPSVHYFVDTTKGKGPIFGTCEGGEEVPGQPNLVRIDSGGTQACATKSDNTVYCWGTGGQGQLGNGGNANSSTPLAVTVSGALAGKTLQSLQLGFYYSCVVTVSDGAYCWGQPPAGGGGGLAPSAVTTSGALAGKKFKAIAAGFSHICGIATDDKAYCFGANNFGQLGNGTNTTSSSPVPVTTSGALSGKTITSISSTTDHTCVIASDDNAYCWGHNDQGQLGNGTTSDSNVPVAVALSGMTAKSISTGNTHTCAIASDNNAYCWGYNAYGGLGNGTGTPSSTPVPVATSGALSGKTIKAIDAGYYFSCAIASDNKAYCWGYGYDGQLGNGTTSPSSSPVAVTTSGALSGKTIKSISAGSGSVCVLTSGNSAYCWGDNYYGKLGNGLTADSPSPVQVIGL